MHEQFWERVAELPREETARRAKCEYRAESDAFVLSLLNTEYLVHPTQRTILAAAPSAPDRVPGYLQQLCLLAYLVNAKDLPPAGRLVGVEKLDPGGFFFRGSHRLPIEKLTAVFGRDLPLFQKVGRTMNAMTRDFGDASLELAVLPRIPLTLVLWTADEEWRPQTRNNAFGEPFPARVSILYDQNATAQLPLDVLFAVAGLTISGILSIVDRLS